MFVEAAPSGSLQNYLSVTWKTTSDRLRKVLVDHRNARKKNAVASGIVEVRDEREEFLDDMALEVNEQEENTLRIATSARSSTSVFALLEKR